MVCNAGAKESLVEITLDDELTFKVILKHCFVPSQSQERRNNEMGEGCCKSG